MRPFEKWAVNSFAGLYLRRPSWPPPVFLVGYPTLRHYAGMTRFTGHGWIRPVYFTLLASHAILAAAIVPLVPVTLNRALKARFDRHVRIARWTLPLWFYVSVTGVLVYLMLYRLYRPT